VPEHPECTDFFSSRMAHLCINPRHDAQVPGSSARADTPGAAGNIPAPHWSRCPTLVAPDRRRNPARRDIPPAVGITRLLFAYQTFRCRRESEAPAEPRTMRLGESLALPVIYALGRIRVFAYHPCAT